MIAIFGLWAAVAVFAGAAVEDAALLVDFSLVVFVSGALDVDASSSKSLRRLLQGKQKTMAEDV